MKKSKKSNKITRKLSQSADQKMLEELSRFAEYHPPMRLSKNLRSLLMDFLSYDGAGEAPYLQDLVHDLQGLFELLEDIQHSDARHK